MGENLELSEEKSCDIISYKRALNLLLSLTDYTDLDSEILPLDNCLDRVLSVRVKALIDNPNQDVFDAKLVREQFLYDIPRNRGHRHSRK